MSGAPNGDRASSLEPVADALERVLPQLMKSDFLLTDPHGHVTRWGEPARLLFGWEPERMVGASVFETVLGEGPGDSLAAWTQFLDERRGGLPPASFAGVGRHRDGQSFAVELTFLPVRLSEGSEFSLFVRDLTSEVESGPKLAQLQRDHAGVLESIAAALSSEMSLDEDERLAGVLIAFQTTGPTPWVQAALRDAEEVADGLVAGSLPEGAGERLAQALADARHAEREVDELRTDTEAIREELARTAARAEQLEQRTVQLQDLLGQVRSEAADAEERSSAAGREASEARAEAQAGLARLEQLERDAGALSARLEGASDSTGALSERLVRVESEVEAGERRRGALEAESAEEHKRLARLQAEHEERGARLSETADLLASERGRLDQVELRQQGDQDRLGALEAGVAGAAEQLARLSGELERRVEEVRAQVSAGPADAGPAEPAALSEAVERLTAELDAARDRVDRLDRVADAAERAVGEAAGARAEADAAAAQARSTREESRAMAEAAEQRAEAALRDAAAVSEDARVAREEAASAASSASEARRGTEAALAEAERSRSELADVRAEAAAARAEAGEARTEAQRLSARPDAWRDELEAVRSEVREAVRAAAAARRASEELSAGLADALGRDGPTRPALRLAPMRRVPAPKKPPPRPPRDGFDDAGEPRAVIDLDGRFLELNPRFCELVGYDEREFASTRWPSPLTDKATLRRQRKLRQALAAGEREDGELKTAYLHREGLLVPVTGRVCVLRDEQGAPRRLLLVCTQPAT